MQKCALFGTWTFADRQPPYLLEYTRLIDDFVLSGICCAAGSITSLLTLYPLRTYCAYMYLVQTPAIHLRICAMYGMTTLGPDTVNLG